LELSNFVFMSIGSVLNILTSKQYTPFWYLVTFAEGWYKFACCPVLMLCTSEFTGNCSSFLIMNKRREKIPDATGLNKKIIFARLTHWTPPPPLRFLREPVDLNTLTSKQFQIIANKMQRFLIYLFLQTPYMFQAVPPPIIRST
jgi:hypothetical protein